MEGLDNLLTGIGVEITSEVTEDNRVEVEERRIDPNKEYPEPVPILCCDGLPLLCKQDISVICGQPGTRKTFLCSLIVGSYLSRCTRPQSNKFSTPEDVGRVLWVDTEQGDNRSARILRRLRAMTGEKYPNVDILSLRKDDPAKRVEIVGNAIKMFRPTFVLIDGSADLMNDTNNTAESTLITEFLMKYSEQFNCHILTVVHLNYGTSKPRGHHGSDMMRKAAVQMNVTVGKDKDISIVDFGPKTRDKSTSNFNFAFTVNKDGLPEFTDIPEKGTAARTDNGAIVVAALEHTNGLTSGQLANRIVAKKAAIGETITQSTARGYISECKRSGRIGKVGNLFTPIDEEDD